MIARWLLFALLAFVPLGAPATTANSPSFSITNVSVNESAGMAVLTILKSASAKSWSRVTVTTIDGTAKAPGDYQASSFTLTFGNNQLSQTISIPIVNDATAEPAESFAVRLTAVRNAVIAHGATVTIIDDDVAPPPPSGNWALAPLTNGGYAQIRNWRCCNGRVVRIAPLNPDWQWANTLAFADLNVRRPVAIHFLEDQPGTWLDDDPTATWFFYPDDLQGVAPAS